MTPAQIQQALTDVKAQLQRTFRMVDGLLAALEAEPIEPVHPTGCPHAHVANVGTLNNPGGKLCLDCEQPIP